MWIAKALLKGTLISFIIAALIATIIGGTAYTRLSGSTIDAKKLVIQPKPTIIYDKNGNVLATFSKENKQKTTYDEIPEEIIDAVISTEDRDFFEHVGVNPKAIARAGIQLALHKGSITQGGSTITQQVVKNLFVGNQETFQRKIKEAILATTLEQYSTKKDIITAYLSHIDFGYQSFGVKNAVETYFGETLDQFKQEPREERIIKAAFIAGLPQGPYGYSPYDAYGNIKPTFDNTLQRRNQVLYNLWEEKYITKQEYDTAMQNKDLLVLKKVNRVHQDQIVKYPEFVQYVLSEVAQKLGYKTVEDARYCGLKIYTSFDPQMYDSIRKTYEDNSLFPPNAKDGTPIETASVIINPQNGEIEAMVGSRENNDQFLQTINRAYQMKRQPGSSIKPVMEYGAALESGKYTANSRLVDQRGYVFPGGYVVKDSHNLGVSRVSMTTALAQSLNIPAVYMLQQVGIKPAKTFAERLGLTFAPSDIYLPIAIGGLEEGETPLQMADAYQAFANGGYRIPAHAIKRMVDSDGKVVYEADTKLTEDKRVMKQTTADDMKSILRQVVTSGTGVNANIPGQEIEGKTGTTEYDAVHGANKDAWFIGFTQNYVTAVWMGFDQTTPNRYLTQSDSSWRSANLYKQIMEPILQNNPSPVQQAPEKPKEVIPKVQALKVDTNVDEQTKSVKFTWDYQKNTVYQIYRDDQQEQNVQRGSYSEKGLIPGTTYVYKIIGYDQDTKYQTYESQNISVTVPENTSSTNQTTDTQNSTSDSGNTSDNTSSNSTTDTTNNQ